MLSFRVFQNLVFLYDVEYSQNAIKSEKPFQITPEIRQPWMKQTCRRIHKKQFNGWFIELADYPRTVEALKPHIKRMEIIPETVYHHLTREPMLETFQPNQCSVWDTLMPFQQVGVREACSRRRFMIADDMGLGKTMQGIGFLDYFKHEGSVLILCPAAVKASWKFHLEQHLNETPNVIEKGKDVFLETINVLSYGMLNSAVFKPKCSRRFQTVVVDESHYIKHSSAMRSQQTYKWCRNATNVLLLSGTPMNRAKELFTQIKCVSNMFGRFHHYNQRNMNAIHTGPRELFYADRYCAPRLVYLRHRQVINFDGLSHEDELHSLLKKHVMIRRTKADVLDLPEKVRERVVLYDKLRVEEKDDFMEKVRDTAQLKLPYLVQYVKEVLLPELENGGKVLLWAHHHFVLDALDEALGDIGKVRMDGKTSLKQRAECVDKFQSDPRVQVALLGITAMATGVTLTAATLAIKCELAFSPDIHLQAEDRMHRIGQKSNVCVRYLMVTNKQEATTDEIIWGLLSSKVNHASLIVDGENKRLRSNRRTHNLEPGNCPKSPGSPTPE